MLLGELIEWWKFQTGKTFDSLYKATKNVHERLQESLNEDVEKRVLRVYFNSFFKTFQANLPALIPQVYLHYNPYTIKQLNGEKRLNRQRMDFLLLLPDRSRIVIEIDGKQHYAEGNAASPKLYSEMVAEDRRLKLAGYEIYRFGGYELSSPNAKEVIENFFIRLFDKHNISIPTD